ncbi:MAG: transporter ATP-binding protein, partial [Mycobacterium sp.]|nr:transporter ATP-binding protein [Mycobacterium sp.]
AQEAIRDDLEGTHKYPAHDLPDDTVAARHRSGDEEPTASIPVVATAES